MYINVESFKIIYKNMKEIFQQNTLVVKLNNKNIENILVLYNIHIITQSVKKKQKNVEKHDS